MKNWPKPKRTFWQSMLIQITPRILDFAIRTKNSKIKFLKSLKLNAKLSSYPSEVGLIACPDGLNVELSGIGFSDIFFPEDFYKLQNGLSKMLDDYPSHLMENKRDLNEWFKSITNNRNISIASYNINISFSNNTNKSLRLLGNASLSLHYISPSFITLSIIIYPSDELAHKFSTQIRKIPSPQSEILGFNKNGISGWAFKPPIYTRKAELEEFFLEINKAVVTLFRKIFGVGLSYFGPLPCIEI